MDDNNRLEGYLQEGLIFDTYKLAKEVSHNNFTSGDVIRWHVYKDLGEEAIYLFTHFEQWRLKPIGGIVGMLPWFWKKFGDFVSCIGLKFDSEIIHTLSFLSGLMVWSQIIDLPFSLYSTFLLEARRGFNKQTIGLFFRGMFKGICISTLLGPSVIVALIVIVQEGGPYLTIYLWVFMFVLSILMMTLYLILIAPLFNKLTPLPDGELREKIEKLAASLKFPLKKLFVVDGSTRSSHSNAYMYWFLKDKRIVLYDTLIQQCKDVEEVVAVIGHELGHWKLNDTVFSLFSIQIYCYACCFEKGSHQLLDNKGWNSLLLYVDEVRKCKLVLSRIKESRAYSMQAFVLSTSMIRHRRMTSKTNKAIAQILVQWLNRTVAVGVMISLAPFNLHYPHIVP